MATVTSSDDVQHNVVQNETLMIYVEHQVHQRMRGATAQIKSHGNMTNEVSVSTYERDGNANPVVQTCREQG